MDTVYVNAFRESSTTFCMDVETLVILSVLKQINSNKVKLAVKLLSERPLDPLITVDFQDIQHDILSSVPEVTLFCRWPIIVKDQHIIAGVCSVARQLVKYSSDKEVRNLLGFREACLIACAENSVWTRFCEVDIITTTRNVINNKYHRESKVFIPEDIARFEFHMSKPVRMHNIYKIAREKNNDKETKAKHVSKENLNVEHSFGEGMFMTLADIILYPCFNIFFHSYPLDIVKDKIPLTVKWYQKINGLLTKNLNFRLPLTDDVITEVLVPSFVEHSLYTGDSTRHRSEKRVHTKQNYIDAALKQILSLENHIVNEQIPFGNEVPFNWSDIPLEANPNGGALPKKRANRKSEQLENLAKAVTKLAIDKKYKIIDFCSGSGHLGILLAVYLPNCEIVLVENKERSLARAQERIHKLKLQNITIVQSNLDYFHGDFDIGVALHACGVATDLVIQNCIEKQAHFVSCPCCYGGVKNCHQLTYPRSRQFQLLQLEYMTYINLAHAADQTHDVDNVKTKQGYFCMDVIDTDRRLYAESYGYEVHLGKLQPNSCTNKNNLLVGICNMKD